MLTKSDKWLISVVIIIAVTGILLSMSLVMTTGNKVAEVRVNGQLVKTMPLRTGYHEKFKIGKENEYNIIETDNGRVRMIESDCPDQICVKTGWIQYSPGQIVCLPFHVVVKVVATHTDIDDIAR